MQLMLAHEPLLVKIKKHNPLVQVELRDTHCRKFGYACDDVITAVMSQGDYVMSDFNGNDLGTQYEKLSGVMDRFFIPRKIYNGLRAYPRS